MDRQTCPMKVKDVIDRYFLENRAKLIDIAAFLDRIDRSEEAGKGQSDFRYLSFQRALHLLTERKERRAEAVQRCFSDLSTEPRGSAAGLKGAYGAWEGAIDEDH